MKPVFDKKEKAVSPIIATILLIAITVVLAATLVTILGGFTHGVGNTVETASASVSEVSFANITDITHYCIYINVSASALNLSASSVGISVNGASVGTLAGPTSTLTANKSNPSYFNAGSVFKFNSTSKVTSIILTYKGATIYTDNSITIKSVGNTVEIVSLSVSEVENTNAPVSYYVYINVSASTFNLSASSVGISVNGASVGTLAGPTSTLTANKSNPSYFNAGSVFVFKSTSKVTSITLTYKGTTIFTDNSITIKTIT
ncbi:archaellin/type IV pilin N-terminal domain-containing protein [Caldiplasma sukawensis]